MSAYYIRFVTLYIKELRRFTKIPGQTILAPAATTLLFMVIFSTAIGNSRNEYILTDFKSFLFPGLIMMTIIQNAFMNNSSSLLMSKVQGNIVDLLMPPISNFQIIVSFILVGVTRGLTVAIAAAIFMLPFVQIEIYSFTVVLFFAVISSAILSLIGLLTGIWADKWDHLGTIDNFIIIPLSFLSGTFYSIKILPEFIQKLSLFNPFFYMIDGFRYGFIGLSDVNIMTSIQILILCFIILLFFSYLILQSGYKLRH
jgi:ABC-2 type transport system permease protein|tara:strand:- start:205 stop:972 length:768 start_codon:yes stop_codon:yes gene_type:complete